MQLQWQSNCPVSITQARCHGTINSRMPCQVLHTWTSLCSASYVSWQCDAAHSCCWALAVQQSICISCPWAHSSKPTTMACCSLMMRQTNRLTSNRYIDPVPHNMRAVSVTEKCYCQTVNGLPDEPGSVGSTLVFFLHLFHERIFWDKWKWNKFCVRLMPFLASNQETSKETEIDDIILSSLHSQLDIQVVHLCSLLDVKCQ